MIITTTSTIEGHPVRQYLGVVTGEVIMGANVFRDFMASITDMVGGRSGAYESKLQEARDAAFAEMTQKASRLGATAIIGTDIDYEVIRDGMLMVAVSGTAVMV
ncbi:YbjQ family protein [Paenibacillus sp. PAMC21692]|uniref:YbjQ family protein n=1 Tax=Paenibacillus sp. PAMC21692 TaxID=2762320 RepID=UPI00164EAA57|nr:YbjQ family protein [Paenibacillus sp. PAMC21692]QNK57455.1 YbjQ family protein [Paenibacillus sp. PAMC21692]